MTKRTHSLTFIITALAMMLTALSSEGMFPAIPAIFPEGVTAQAVESDLSDLTGVCGENVTFSLNWSSGILTISGEGSMTKGPRDAYYEASYFTTDIAKSVKEVVIEKGITNIPENAFAGHENLTRITIPDTVTSIGKNAFGNSYIGDLVFASDGSLTGGQVCKSLTSITLPDSVTSIGERAFYGCFMLEDVKFSKNLKTIDKEAFMYCKKLKSANISGVTEIPASTFRYCGSLETVDLSQKLKSIGEIAFYECSKLNGVKLPDTLTSIGVLAFGTCQSLSEIKIPDSVTELGGGAFSNCTSLKTANIPSRITSIREKLFYGDESLSSINIPNGVTTIGDQAFADCKKLADVTIPASVTHFGDFVFYGTAWQNAIITEKELVVNDVLLSLKKASGIPVYVADGVTEMAGGSANYQIFYENKTDWRYDLLIVIPESVTKIDDYAFWTEEQENDRDWMIGVRINVQIYGTPGSYAEAWAKEHEIKFKDVAELTQTKETEPFPVYTTTVTGPVYTRPAKTTASSNETKTSATTTQNTTTTVQTKQEDPSSVMLGDVNGDNAIDIMDVIAINKYLLGSAMLDDAHQKAADVDGSNQVDSSDSLTILKYVVELIDHFETNPAQQETTVPLETRPVQLANRKITDADVQFKPSANASVEWETYSDEDVTIEIPKGWEVKCSTLDLQLYYQVTDPSTGISWTYCDYFMTFSADQETVDYCKATMEGYNDRSVLPSATAKAFYEWLYGANNPAAISSAVTSVTQLGDSPLKQLMVSAGESQNINETDYSAIMMDLTLADENKTSAELLGVAGVNYIKQNPMSVKDERKVPELPKESDYPNLDEWYKAYQAYTKAYADAPMIELDLSTYNVYDTRFYIAPKGELSNWKPVLDKSIASIKTTEAYQKKLNEKIQKQTDALTRASLSSSSVSTSDTMDMMYDSWKKRQESQDYQSQKWSDYTLGYDRVYDTQTGDTYRTSYGFMDNYSGTRYRLAEGTEYLLPIEGTFDFTVDQNGNVIVT